MRDLRSRRHDADLQRAVRQKPKDRLFADGSRRLFHQILLHGKRNHAHPCEQIAPLDRHVLRRTRHHDVIEIIEPMEALDIDGKYAVMKRPKLDLALLRLRGFHSLVLTEAAQDLRRFILVQQRAVVFPDVEMLLAQREQHGDVRRLDDMPLAKACTLPHAAHDLRDVVTENLPDRIFHGDFLHRQGAHERLSFLR